MTATPNKNRENTTTWKLLALPPSVRVARDHTAAALRSWGLRSLVDDAILVVSELVTNACSPKVARGREIGLTLSYVQEKMVLIEVTDPGEGHPRPKVAGESDEGGRGLFIVRTLSCDFGVRGEADGGKTVWAVLTEQG